jgi:hypothetical protein
MKDSKNVEEKTDVKKEKTVDQENETSQEAIAAITCAYCSEKMFRYVLPKFNRTFGIIILVVGVLLSLFMSPLLGLPMVVIGAYMGVASRAIWMCESCGTAVERIDA